MDRNFTIRTLDLPGVLLLTPVLFTDERGVSLNTYDAEVFTEFGISKNFVLEYASYSKQDVIRGLHFQREPHAQAKLIRLATGRVLDVVADPNPISPQFGKHVSVTLDANKGEMLYVPEGYAHGFCVLSPEGALVEYKLSAGYHPESAAGVRFNDPFFNINWPTSTPIVSVQDQSWPVIKL